MPPTAPQPPNWRISRAIRSELPKNQKATAEADLWNKSAGICALCSEPLPTDDKGAGIDCDHVIPRSASGPTELGNLYLAHHRCNVVRQDLPFEIGKKLVIFEKWCQIVPLRPFSDVRKHYSFSDERVVYKIDGNQILINFGPESHASEVFTDPPTGTRYFFTEVPISYILNDAESQPRWIEYDHVRALAKDFYKEPVHEPSNCRLVTLDHRSGLGELKQFDGQHKTTAQIILGRDRVPMKIYIDPDKDMIQELVLQIQGGIRKRPLTISTTLKKLDEVVRAKIEAYRQEHGVYPTEQQLVTSLPSTERKTMKARLLSNFCYAILSDEDNKITQFASPKSDRLSPLTENILVNKIIKPLVGQELLDDPLDNPERRETERAAIVKVLNQIAENVLIDRWEPKPKGQEEDLGTRRARNFFYQGGVGWWMTDLLLQGLHSILPKSRHKGYFLKPLEDREAEEIEEMIGVFTGYPIWSTTDSDALKALRSNTIINVRESAVFSPYDHVKMMIEVRALK